MTESAGHLAEGEVSSRAPLGRAKEILAVAARLFAEQGYAGTRMTDVAAGLGVTKPIIYRFYKSKEDLFEAVVEASLQNRIADAVGQLNAIAYASADSLKDYVAVAYRIIVDDEATMPWIVALGESNKVPELGKHLMERFARPFVEALEELFERTAKAGHLRPGATPGDLAWLLLAPCVQLVVFRCFGTLTEDPARGREHLQTHLDSFCRAWLT
jgi:AcrR family transcriptional regulator